MFPRQVQVRFSAVTKMDGDYALKVNLPGTVHQRTCLTVLSACRTPLYWFRKEGQIRGFEHLALFKSLRINSLGLSFVQRESPRALELDRIGLPALIEITVRGIAPVDQVNIS